ncbi:hypothetical protein FRC02_008012 [Tulasnella sp. 418]|nr:hypothetical protein FRC02_008012 [Tulasnella sp. 418]
MSQCAALHPDKTPTGNEDDEAFFEEDSTFETFNGNDEEELSEAGRAALEHLESILAYPKTNLNGAYDNPDSDKN